MLIIIIILSLTILFSFYHIRYKKPSGKADVDRVTDMTEEAENALLKKLEEFERSKRYLEKDITVSKMATLLNSNSKYTASIICRHRGKRVSEYISDLKIDHIVHLLSNEAKYRNYTYKALCEEVGFGSPQNFSRVFKNRMGIGVGEFIEKLED